MNPPCRSASATELLGIPRASGLVVLKASPDSTGSLAKRAIAPVSGTLESRCYPIRRTVKIIRVIKKACQQQFLLHRRNNFLIIRIQRADELLRQGWR
jgi:hypothetical protein